MTTTDELLRFGPFELDPQAEELRRSGLVLRLPPQPFRILVLLVRRAGEVVTREEIQQEIWKDETFVDFEHGINSAIRQIRFVLGDTAEAPRYVRTIPRKGYQFVVDVDVVRASARAGQASARVGQASACLGSPLPPEGRAEARPTLAIAAMVTALLVLFAAAGIVASSRKSAEARVVAVQPFRWIGTPQPGLDARTFAEELSARVATLPPNRVQLVDAQSADVLIDGSVRRVDGRVRVIVSAIDGKTRTQLWSETIERPAERNDGIAVEVAHRTLAELARRYLPPPRREPLVAAKVDPAAMKAYRLARLERGQAKGYDVARIEARYGEAIRLEPQFAEAWSGLGELHAANALTGPTATRNRAAAAAHRCATRALELQPRNAEALTVLGILAAQRDYDLVAGEALFRRAVMADPEYVDAHVSLANVLATLGRGEESLRAWETARRLDPAGLDLSPQYPLLHLYARRYDDARARYREILAVHPEMRIPKWGVLSTYVAQQQWAEAIRAARALGGPDLVEGVEPTPEGVRRMLLRFQPLIERNLREQIIGDYFAATFYAQAGDRDRAFAALDRAVEARLPVVSYLRVDPRIDLLRGDPRFDTLLAKTKMRAPAEWLVAVR
ncbi:MAG TPA: winged helix-turn-helix domain-containing protein [Thermoanaerobaculia bacterium]